MTQLLRDKVAVITGAASGIGKDIAVKFAEAGAKVCIADLALDRADAAAQEIKRSGGAAMAVAMNVTDEAQVDAGIARLAEKWGSVDVLVSNAGVQHIDAVENLSLANWKNLLAI